MRQKGLQADIWKLTELRKKHRLAIPAVTFFFRGAPREGIDKDTIQLCSEIASEIASRDNVIFLYGPRPRAYLSNNPSRTLAETGSRD